MRALVNAPDIFQHSHSLEKVANVHTGVRAEEGVAFSPKGCEVIFAHDAGCWVGDKKALNQCHLAEFDAFVLELTLAWSTLDLIENPEARAVEAMEVGTSAVMERLACMAPAYVATGTDMTIPALSGAVATGGITGKAATSPTRVGAHPYLINAVDVTTGADTPLGALGNLEAKMLDASDHIGSAGTIWTNPADFVQMGNLVFAADGTLRTLATGSRVIVGNITPGQMFATVGEVDLYLGPIEKVETTETATNETIVQVERFAVATWNTCAAFKHATA
jgi:hypothetical protein